MSRYLIYSHDTYGLGHFRRCTLIAAGLVSADPTNEVLIATGSPRAHAFRLPERVDSIKLPSATKDPAGCYQPRKLGGSMARLVALRSALLLSALAAYEPDVILIDHAPIGMAGELLPVLRRLGSARTGGARRPRLVLGLRDIVDEAPRVEADWDRDDVWSWMTTYDDILVYGDPRILTTAVELNLDRRVAARVTHTGYVAPSMPGPIGGPPFLLVTPGGGGDGQSLLRHYLDAVDAGATAGVRSVVVTGPLMSSGRRAELLTRAESMASVELIEFTDQMRSLVASARGVVSMAGYNTVVEELAAGVPALLVPRTEPRREQAIRAQRIAPRSQLEYCGIEHLTPERISSFAAGCTSSVLDTRPRHELDLRGVAAVTAALRPAGPKASRSATPTKGPVIAHAH